MNHRPSYIQFYPTLSCNQSCSFCFNRHLEPIEDVTVSDFGRIVSFIKELGITNMDILGGEPTLHQDFLELMDLMCRNGIQVAVSSNGTDVKALKALHEKYSKDSVRIGISINSHSVENALYDYILKFRPVLKSIFDQNCIIPASVHEFIGLPGIDYFLLYMDVVDQDDLKNSMPFYDYYKKLDEIKSAQECVHGVFCAGFMPDTLNYPELASVRCPAGTTKLSILPDGRVYPCYLFFRYPEFELGNILYDDFEKIWHHPILQHFRRFEKNRCPKTQCDLYAFCHGGCPAMSFHFYRDLAGPDPRCIQG